MTVLFYSGIGSRETPPEYLELMTMLARKLASEGWMLRSGGAPGADSAFEDGTPAAQRVIYLPWRGFNERWNGVVPEAFSNYMEAEKIARRLHPAWDNLKRGARALMTRNIYQILGDDLRSPSRSVICWASNPKFDGEGRVVDVKGGTGQAVRLAAEHNIPVYHLGVPEHMNRMCAYLGIEPLPTTIKGLAAMRAAKAQQQALEENTAPATGGPGFRKPSGRL